MKPKTIGTAVKTPIWNKNCAFRAALRAVFPNTSATSSMDSPTPDNAYKKGNANITGK